MPNEMEKKARIVKSVGVGLVAVNSLRQTQAIKKSPGAAVKVPGATCLDLTKTRISWRMTYSLTTMVCRRCSAEGAGKFLHHGFAMELCDQMGIAPVWRIPHYRSRLRGLIRRHYKECHPEWEVI